MHGPVSGGLDEDHTIQALLLVGAAENGQLQGSGLLADAEHCRLELHLTVELKHLHASARERDCGLLVACREISTASGALVIFRGGQAQAAGALTCFCMSASARRT